MIHHNEFVKSTCSKQFFKEVGYELVLVLTSGYPSLKIRSDLTSWTLCLYFYPLAHLSITFINLAATNNCFGTFFDSCSSAIYKLNHLEPFKQKQEI